LRIDGDTGTSNFWQGGTANDELKLTFDRQRSISEIKIFTNNTNFAVSNGGSRSNAPTIRL